MSSGIYLRVSFVNVCMGLVWEFVYLVSTIELNYSHTSCGLYTLTTFDLVKAKDFYPTFSTSGCSGFVLVWLLVMCFMSPEGKKGLLCMSSLYYLSATGNESRAKQDTFSREYVQ